MSSKRPVALHVEQISKEYQIGGQQDRFKTLRDTLATAAARTLRRAARPSEAKIWALRDISFDIQFGEAVGIIGHNGAGKSTLLKILSRITEPTSGLVDVYGRVGALLEVGTGFHQELTGRENIYLNGAILGMSRLEIDHKFDEIVAFSGIEKFIDTPVKHYSSGMSLRLGFAVAAHLEPEILLIDEILAVGDQAFQQKCLGKMREVGQSGRTVLFVSHQLAAVRQICPRCILLHGGEIMQIGTSDEVITQYVKMISPENQLPLRDRAAANQLFQFTDISLHDQYGDAATTLTAGEPIEVRIAYASPLAQPLQHVSIAVRVEDMLGQYIFTLATEFTGADFASLPATGTLICQIPRLPLLEGSYKLFLWSSVNGQRADVIENALEFAVIQGDVYGSGKFPLRSRHGVVFVEHRWEQTAEAKNVRTILS